MTTKWSSYEEVAQYLLNQFANEFDLERVEGKQKVDGIRSGTKWQIDAKGVRLGEEGFVIIECRRYTTSKQSQEKLGGLAYRIIDTGADCGIIVSPLGLQKGAQKIASSEGIIDVSLNANCTITEFCMKFLNKVMIGVQDTIGIREEVFIKTTKKCSKCGEEFTVKGRERICEKCL